LDFAVFAFQAVPPAPGRASPAAPGSQETEAPKHGGSDAPPPGGGLLGGVFPLLLIAMLVFFFFSTRSQQKKQDQTISSLKKGDRVVTQSGLVGRLVDIEPRYAKVEIAPGVKVQILRTSLTGRDADDATATKDKDKAEPASEKKP
jgi:preprotein translocase subunit YajC